MHAEQIQSFKKRFDDLIVDKKSVMVVSHKGPDDDSIASMLGVYRYISKKYPEKNVELFTFSIPETRWGSFQDFDKIHFVIEDSYDFSRFDFLIGVDACQFSRFHPKKDFFDSFKGESVCIDHHKNDPDNFTAHLVLGDYSSNAELVHNIFFSEGTLEKITAETLLLGILGDTGNFRFVSSEQSDVFLVAKRLVDAADISIQGFQSRYSTYPVKTFEIIQNIVTNARIEEIPGWPKFIISYIDRKYIAEHQLDDGMVSAATHIFIAQYGLSMTECSWGMVFSPRADGSVSGSMRSRPGSVNVRMIGQQTGKGGGHDRAAAVKFLQDSYVYDTQECIEWLKKWLSENKPVLE